MNKTIKTVYLIFFVFLNSLSTVYAQTTEEAIKHNTELNNSFEEAEIEDSFSIFNSTNSTVNFTCIGYENFTDKLEPYKPQKDNYKDISGRSYFSYELKDRKQYGIDYSPEYIEYKPTPESKPVRIEVEYTSYTCYVFYILDGELKLGRCKN